MEASEATCPAAGTTVTICSPTSGRPWSPSPTEPSSLSAGIASEAGVSGCAPTAATRSTTRTSPATRRSRATTNGSTGARCWDSSAIRATPSRRSLTCISRCTRTACCTSGTTGRSIRRPTWRAGSGSTGCRRPRRSGCPAPPDAGRVRCRTSGGCWRSGRSSGPPRPAALETHRAAKREAAPAQLIPTGGSGGDGWGAVAAALGLLAAASAAVGIAARKGRSS